MVVSSYSYFHKLTSRFKHVSSINVTSSISKETRDKLAFFQSSRKFSESTQCADVTINVPLVHNRTKTSWSSRATHETRS
ncbi:hypothetical protein MPTK2_5g20800 [Marchantia polymorpha subsp. ruderalis]